MYCGFVCRSRAVCILYTLLKWTIIQFSRSTDFFVRSFSWFNLYPCALYTGHLQIKLRMASQILEKIIHNEFTVILINTSSDEVIFFLKVETVPDVLKPPKVQWICVLLLANAKLGSWGCLSLTMHMRVSVCTFDYEPHLMTALPGNADSFPIPCDGKQTMMYCIECWKLSKMIINSFGYD